MKQIKLKPSTLYKCELEGNEFFIKLDVNEIRLLFDGHLHHINILEETSLLRNEKVMCKEIDKKMCKEIDELLQVLDIECTCYKETCDKCIAKHEIDKRLKAINKHEHLLKQIFPETFSFLD